MLHSLMISHLKEDVWSKKKIKWIASAQYRNLAVT